MGEYGHIVIANHINSILEFISMIELTIWTAFFPCVGTNYGVNLGEAFLVKHIDVPGDLNLPKMANSLSFESQKSKDQVNASPSIK